MSSRPQRQTKPSQIIRDINADKAAAKPAAQKQPRKAKAPAPAAQPAPAPAVSNDRPIILSSAAYFDTSAFRGLNLDLSTVPKSKDPKFNPSFNSYENPFWEKFYTPVDGFSKRYMKATDQLITILPATFMLIEDIPESFGVANLELKEEYKKPIVNVPLFSKLKNKEYETQQSKSDTNIAASINFLEINYQLFSNIKKMMTLVGLLINIAYWLLKYLNIMQTLQELQKKQEKTKKTKKKKKTQKIKNQKSHQQQQSKVDLTP